MRNKLKGTSIFKAYKNTFHPSIKISRGSTISDQLL